MRAIDEEKARLEAIQRKLSEKTQLLMKVAIILIMNSFQISHYKMHARTLKHTRTHIQQRERERERERERT